MNEIDRAIDLHRLVWDPDDFEDGTLLPSAFNRSEILAPDKYLSVSRMDRFCCDAVIETAEGQSAKANRSDGRSSREISMSAFIGVGDVCDLATEVGEHPFWVTYEPLRVDQGDPVDDPGHSGIRNTEIQGSNKEKKALAQALQALLADKAGERVCPLIETLARHALD